MKRKVIRVVLVVFVLTVGFVAFQALRPPETLIVSPETTVVTAPLHADGTPHYAKYLLEQWREGVTPENNGAIAFWKALWPSDLSPEDQATIQHELKLSADSTRPPFCVTSSKLWDEVRYALLENSTDDEMVSGDLMDDSRPSPTEVVTVIKSAMTSQPWIREELPLVADWIDRHTADYELLSQASMAVCFYSPPAALIANPDRLLADSMVSVDLLQPMRDAVDNLQARAMLRIGEKRYAEAWDDCQIGFRLSDRMPDTGVLSRLWQLVVRSAMLRTTNQLLSADLPKQLIAQIAQQLSNLPWKRDGWQSVDTLERLMALDLAVRIRASQASFEDRKADSLTDFNRYANRNLVVSKMNAYYDDAVAALQGQSYQERMQRLQAIEERLAVGRDALLMDAIKSIFSRSARANLLFDMDMNLLLPPLSALTFAEDRFVLDVKFTRLHAKLAAHFQETGERPTDLNEFIKVAGADALSDPVFGGSLQYQQTRDGFVLYSLGGNQRDDGGSNAKMKIWMGWDLSDNDAIVKYLAKAQTDVDLSSSESQATDNAVVNGNFEIPAEADDHALRVHNYRQDLSDIGRQLRELNISL